MGPWPPLPPVSSSTPKRPSKSPEQFTLLGKPQKRLDVPLKANGTAIFGIDVRLPDMLYASVVTCPVFGGKLKSHNFDALKGMPGVKAAVEVPNGIAVVVDSFWRAKTALEVMPVEWDLGAHANVSSADLQKLFRAELDKEGVVANEKGDALAVLQGAAKVVEADYEVPYLAHATMEPMNCTAQVTPERVDVWLGTQNSEGALTATAELLGVAPDNVYVHTCFLGGGFGRRFYNDDVKQAVTIANAMAGKPVKLIWTREEDMRHDFYRPMAAIRFRAGLDANGVPVAYFNRSVMHSILSWVRPDAVKSGNDSTSVEGLANTPYAFGQQRIEHLIQNTHVPVGFWRSVGGSQNAFAIESFMDELAHAAGKDPVEFRRMLLKGRPDWLLVLDTMAQKANWGKPLPKGAAQGVAIFESYGSVMGQVAEVSVSKRGEVRVEHVVCAVDGGHVVNPAPLRNGWRAAWSMVSRRSSMARSASRRAALPKAISIPTRCSASMPCPRLRRPWRSAVVTSGAALANRASRRLSRRCVMLSLRSRASVSAHCR